MGILAGIGSALSGVAEDRQRAEELALRRALQGQQMKIAAEQNARAGQTHDLAIEKGQYDASQRPITDARQQLEMLLKIDPTGWFDNPQAVATAQKANIPLQQQSLDIPRIQDIEGGKFGQSPYVRTKEEVGEDLGISPTTGVPIPPMVQNIRLQQKNQGDILRNFNLDTLPKEMKNALGYNIQSGGDNPPAEPVDRNYKTWTLPGGQTVNLPGNVAPPQGAKPFAQPLAPTVIFGDGGLFSVPRTRGGGAGPASPVTTSGGTGTGASGGGGVGNSVGGPQQGGGQVQPQDTAAQRDLKARGPVIMESLNVIGSLVDKANVAETALGQSVRGAGLSAQSIPYLGPMVGAAMGSTEADTQLAMDFDNTINGSLAQLARLMGEVGVLTDPDVARARGIVPKFNTPKPLAQKMMMRLRNYVQLRVGGVPEELAMGVFDTPTANDGGSGIRGMRPEQ